MVVDTTAMIAETAVGAPTGSCDIESVLQPGASIMHEYEHNISDIVL